MTNSQSTLQLPSRTSTRSTTGRAQPRNYSNLNNRGFATTQEEINAAQAMERPWHTARNRQSANDARNAPRERETDEERRHRLEVDAQRHQEHHGQETDEERRQRLQVEAYRRRQNLEQETEEERRIRLEIETRRRHANLAEETEEDRLRRLESDVMRHQDHLAHETDEERRHRLEIETQRRRDHISQETEEQRHGRLEADSQRRRERQQREHPRPNQGRGRGRGGRGGRGRGRNDHARRMQPQPPRRAANGRRPNQRERAEAAGQLDIGTVTHATPEQLANFDHNLDAGIAMACEITGVQRQSFNMVREALQRIAQIDNPDETQRNEAAINIMRQAMVNEIPTDEEIMHAVRQFQAHMGAGQDLPACACCGVRALPDEAPDYVHVRVDDLDFISYSAQQEEAFQNKSPQAQQMTSSFLYQRNNRRYHLHPELVDLHPAPPPPPVAVDGTSSNRPAQEPQQDHAFTTICPSCQKGIFRRGRNNNDMPPLSIAAGYDYGVLSRAIPNADDMTMVERQALTLRRLYIEAIKLQEADDKKRRARINQDNPRQQVALKGHGIVFTHNAAEGVGESLPLFVEEGSLHESLEVIFVGPRPMHEAMRRSGLTVPDLQVRPEMVIAAYDALVNSNPMYATVPGRLEEQGINRDQIIARLRQITVDLVNHAGFVEDPTALVAEEVATDDIARAAFQQNAANNNERNETAGAAGPTAGDNIHARDNEEPEQEGHGGIHHVMVTSRSELLGGPDAAGIGAVRSLSEAIRVVNDGAEAREAAAAGDGQRRTDAVTDGQRAAGGTTAAGDGNLPPRRPVRGTIRVEQTSNEPINEFANNRELLGGAFPTVFPLGFVSNRQGSLSKRESQHLLRQFTNVAAREQKLIFLLFNQLQRHEASRAVSARVNNQPQAAEDFERFATDPEFVRNVNEACRVLPADASDAERQHQKFLIRNILAIVSPFIRIAGNQVPFSPMQRNFGKSILYALCQTFGMPSIFLTISMDDSYSELTIRLSNPIHGNDAFPVTEAGLMDALRDQMQEVHGIDISPAGLARRTANNPVAAAQTFIMTRDALIYGLLQAPREDGEVRKSVPIGGRPKGVLGVVRTYYGAVEVQGRGSLHLHLVLWTGIPPNFASASAGTEVLEQAVADMLNRTVKAELMIDEHVKSILREQHNRFANAGTAAQQTNNNRTDAAADPTRAAELQQREEALQAAAADRLLRPMTLPNLPPDATVEDVQRRASLVACTCNMHKHTFSCHKGKCGHIRCRFCMARGPCPRTEFVMLHPQPQNPADEDQEQPPQVEGDASASRRYSDEEERRLRYQNRAPTLPPRPVPIVSTNIPPAEPLPEPTLTDPVPSLDNPDRVLVIEPQRREITLDMFEQFLQELEDPDNATGVYLRAVGDRWRANQQSAEDKQFVRQLLRRNGYVSEFNPAVSACIKANTNCMYIGTTEQGKAVLMYLIKYICKDGAELSNSITVVRDCLEHINQYPSRMPAEQDRNPAMRPFLQCMSRIINTLNGAAEVSASAAAYTLLGGKSIICPEHYHFAFVPAAVEACLESERRDANQRNEDTPLDEATEFGATNDAERQRFENAITGAIGEEDEYFDMEDPDIIHIGDQNGVQEDPEINTRGSMPLYEVNGRKVPVAQEACYAARGEELALMNYHTWLRTIAIRPISNSNGGRARQQQQQGQAAEAEEMEGDDENNNQATGRRREPNARFRFRDGFVLAETHEQTMLSKYRVLILAGPRPPAWPGPRPERLTHGWKEKARRYARYMLVLFRPWDVESERAGPLTWRHFINFMTEQYNSDTLYAHHNINQIHNITHCLKVRQPLLKLNNDFRSRATDIWEGYIDPGVLSHLIGPSYTAGGNNGGGGANSQDTTMSEEDALARQLRESIEWTEAAMRINNRTNRQMESGLDTIQSLNRQSRLIRLKLRVHEIFSGESMSEEEIADARANNNRQQAPAVIDIETRFFHGVNHLNMFDDISKALKSSGLLTNMTNETGRRRQRADGGDGNDSDRERRLRRRLNDDDSSEDDLDQPVAGMRRTTEQAGLAAADRDRVPRMPRQEPAAEILVNNPEAQARLRQMLQEGLREAHLNEQQMQIAEELVVYSVDWKVHHDNPDGRDPPRPPMLFVHGGPGTGKTHAMRSLNEVLKDNFQTGGILGAAYTGVAASLLDEGQTINKLLDISFKLADTDPLPTLSAGKRAAMERKLTEYTAFLIDEVSMLSPTLLRRVDERLREVLQRPNWPFGGMLVILQGDMFQLPPVRKLSLYRAVLRLHGLLEPPQARQRTTARPYEDNLTENEREGARLFEQFELRTLSIQERASRDREQIDMINNLRDPRMNVRRLTQRDLSRFRVLTPAEAQNPNWRFAPVLVCDNETRAVINEEQMCNFGREHGLPVIRWIDNVHFRYEEEPSNSRRPNTTTPAATAAQQPRRPTIVLSPEEKTRVLEDNMHHLASLFVPGAPAYLTDNINPTLGLANGTDVTMHSLGFHFENRVEQVNFMNMLRAAQPGEIVTLPRPPSFMNVVVPNANAEQWPAELRLQSIGGGGANNGEVIVPIAKARKGETITLLRSPRIGVSKKATVKSLALSEAMSITYHKSQGKTLPFAILDLREEGLDFEKVYVGMTRTQLSENTRIINLSPYNVLNLQHLLELQPPRELLLWMSGFNEDTTNHRWDSDRVRQRLADEQLARIRGNNSNASNNRNNNATPRPPTTRRDTTPRQATDNSSGGRQPRHATEPTLEPPTMRPLAPQQPLPQQQTRIPTYGQPNNSRNVENFSAVFMPIIAAAANVLPALNTEDRDRYEWMRTFCGAEDWQTLVEGYGADFAARNVRPFFGNNGNRYRYLLPPVQERLLFPAAQEEDEYGVLRPVGLLGVVQESVGDSRIDPRGEVAIALVRVSMRYNELLHQQQ